jgi:hypothetical protein
MEQWLLRSMFFYIQGMVAQPVLNSGFFPIKEAGSHKIILPKKVPDLIEHIRMGWHWFGSRQAMT